MLIATAGVIVAAVFSACRNHARAKQNSGSIRKCPWSKVEPDGASIEPVHQASSNDWRSAVLRAEAPRALASPAHIAIIANAL